LVASSNVEIVRELMKIFLRRDKADASRVDELLDRCESVLKAVALAE
jgi:hypothetical protein